MKLNKSFILISLISIFLLLSISAASAADDMDNHVMADSASDMTIDDMDIDDISDNSKDNNILSQGENTEIIANSTGDSGKIDTTIESENKTYKYGEDIKIPVIVKDNQSNNVTIAKKDLNVSKGNEAINFTFDNESNVVLNQLDLGEYVINIKYLGNATYNAASTSVNLTIEKTNTTIVNFEEKIKNGTTVSFDLIIKGENDFDVPFTKNDIKVYHITETEEKLTFVLKDKKITIANITEMGEHNIKVVFNGTNISTGCEKIIKIIIIDNNTIKANDTLNKTVHDSKDINIPIVITNGYFDVETNKTIVTNLTVEKEDLTLIFKYNNGTENITEVIPIGNFNLTGQPGNYTISFTNDTLKDDGELTIIYKNDTLSEANKTIKFTRFTNVLIEVKNAVVDFQTGNFTFVLKDAETNATLPNVTITIKGVKFYSFVNGSSLSPSKDFTTDANGLIVIENLNLNSEYEFTSLIYNYTALAAGKYNLTFNDTSGGNYNITNENAEITVNPIAVDIIAKNYKQQIGSGVKYTFKVINKKTGEAVKLVSMQFKVKIGSAYSTYNTTTNMSGESGFTINLAGGTYPVIIATNSANLVKNSVSRNMTLTKKPAVLTAYNRTIYFGSAPTTIVRFTDKATGKYINRGIVKVRVYITSKKYADLAFYTNKTGQFKFNMALPVGVHKLIISSGDSNYTASSITRYVTVKKASGKFTAPKIGTYYRSGRIYSIRLTNTKNKANIYGASVNIKVYISKYRFYNYTGVTDGYGKINIKVNYKPGTYKVVVSNNDKGYTAKAVTGQIKVYKHPIKFAPVAYKVKKGNYFKVKVISLKTKKVLSAVKIKVRVYTGKKSKVYTIKTNKKGIANLKVVQSVGKHKIVLTNPATKLYSAKSLTKTMTVTK